MKSDSTNRFFLGVVKSQCGEADLFLSSGLWNEVIEAPPLRRLTSAANYYPRKEHFEEIQDGAFKDADLNSKQLRWITAMMKVKSPLSQGDERERETSWVENWDAFQIYSTVFNKAELSGVRE